MLYVSFAVHTEVLGSVRDGLLESGGGKYVVVEYRYVWDYILGTE
jgi:hypothetical protein